MKPLPLSATIYKSLKDYQKLAVKFCLNQSTAALFCEQGTGKTWITAGLLEKLQEQNETLQALVVVPLNNLVSTWAKLIKSRLPQIRLCKDVERLNDYKDDMHLIVLVHYEGLKKYQKKLLKMDWDLVVYDEAHRLKNRTTGQARLSFKFTKRSTRRVILTGTPMDRNEVDLYAQFNFLDPSVLGTWGEFEQNFLPKKKEFDSKVKAGSTQYYEMIRQIGIFNSRRRLLASKRAEFYGRIAPYSFRVTKSVLDIPPMEVVTRKVPLTLRQRSAYDDMVQHRLHSLPGGAQASSPLSLTLVNKLQQICGGFLRDDDGNDHYLGSRKLTEIERILDEFPDEPVVIFCRYSFEISRIEKRLTALGLRVKTFSGKTKKIERPRIIQNFQAGKIDALVCQIKAGGVGIDLFRSRIGIVYSLSHSYIDYGQLLARLHRMGQARPVIFFLLLCDATIDEKIFEIIVKKRRVTVRVLDEIKRRE
jgi:SNF2 family DNA or RNA helicase